MAVGTESELDAGDLLLRLCGGDGSRSCCPPVCVCGQNGAAAAFCTAIMAVGCREGEARRCRWGWGAAGSAVFSRTFLIASLARCPSGPLCCLGFGLHRPFPRGAGIWDRGGAAMGQRRAEERLCKELGRKGGQPGSGVVFCFCERSGLHNVDGRSSVRSLVCLPARALGMALRKGGKETDLERLGATSADIVGFRSDRGRSRFAALEQHRNQVPSLAFFLYVSKPFGDRRKNCGSYITPRERQLSCPIARGRCGGHVCGSLKRKT